MVPSTYRCSVSPHCMNESGSLSGRMTELTAHDCHSWGYHLNHHKHSKNVEEDGAETQPLFYCRHAAKLWKLVQEIYGAASADQAHLELKGFEWLDLSDPLVTHKIVLPWYDKTSEHTTLKLLGVGAIGMLWIGPRKEQSWDSHWTCEQVTGNCASHSLNGFPECKNQSFPRSQFLKVTNFYKICHPFTVCVCLWGTAPRDRAELSSTYHTGIAHIFMNKMQELKAKSALHKVNIHDTLKMNHKLSTLLKRLTCTQLCKVLRILDITQDPFSQPS